MNSLHMGKSYKVQNLSALLKQTQSRDLFVLQGLGLFCGILWCLGGNARDNLYIKRLPITSQALKSSDKSPQLYCLLKIQLVGPKS